MKTGLIVVTQPLIDEVLTAVQAVRSPSSIYVSRRAIENEITACPEKYPLLSDATRTFLRQIITKVMKRQFSIWGEPTGKKRSTAVWDLSRPAGVIA
jgi:hypothetical protein